ncbi:hypothetical protein [Emcibacter nanhaiensis]|uniref:Copper resistance protein NlpE n=1 Tax=Emcibacter nanhaiensis TaxID=1505037 RepID=A0A501PQ39_9PROT|nr:hypothetical protein [Emcibacter nanhaiensis]TPD62650.1 hypothetical protein FIV46_00790 [Emcibacter nanhaiensis]
MAIGKTSGALTAVLALVLLAGCTTSGSDAAKKDSAPAIQSFTFESGISTLPPREMQPGQCGLFLWSKVPQRELVFYSNSADMTGDMMIDGAARSLTRTSAEGEGFYGQFTRQVFDGEGYSVQLLLEPELRDGMANSVVIPRGSLRLTKPDGWEHVMAVGGLISCQK